MEKNILCVDDSPSIRQIVKVCLEGEGFNVLEAVDGLDALDKVKGNSNINLFVVDVNMPNMDGITFVKELRKIEGFGDTPVIILTTESLASKKVEGKEAGANGWIVKPFDPPQFIKVITRLVGIN